jgi:Zn finger protein HypA/HybF involved in hydrogenase expression
MEANKTTCNVCGKIDFWHGWKTRTLKVQNRDTCRRCGSSDIRIEADTETELGKMYEEQAEFAAGIIGSIINEMITKREGKE